MKHLARVVRPAVIATFATALALLALAPPAETTRETPMQTSIPPQPVIDSLPLDGGEEFNRLIHEQSPYLLQHASNPVDWYPWGDEAFERARNLDRPVFLSIGYSTCHWCHVMEHESFEDPEVAALLNESFVCIKVDREERPDIDAVHMAVAQVMTGSGGWPLTVVLTPERRPFFAGTYIPKHGVYGRPGMMQLLPAIDRAWRDDREGVLASAEKITGFLQQMNEVGEGAPLEPSLLEQAQRNLSRNFDPTFGGFGSAPKFPSPHQLSFLLRRWSRTGDPAALEMVETTLRGMRRGGLFDHLGYGFHRYSTDARWLVPHFEKMLYDQAMLAVAYLEAYQATSDEFYAETAREVFTYVLRDMTSPEGGFYSAEDADSEGVEGLFYVWTVDELRDVLGEETAGSFSAVYGVTERGNFAEEATGHRSGNNILHHPRPLAEVARREGFAVGDLERTLGEARRKLLERRDQRTRPLRDDKVLTDWNGLMIAALARGAVVLDEPEYADAAARAADFCLTELRDDRGRLLKRYRGGRAGLPAHLDDHAFLAWGLLELYEATFEARYLGEAISLTDDMLEHFADDDGGFFLTADDGEELLVRTREAYDGAIPSGNSVAASNLVRLARITGDARYARAADGVLRSFSRSVQRAPEHFATLLMAADFAAGPTHEVVIAGERGDASTESMLAALREPFLPHKVVLFRDGSLDEPPVSRFAPFTGAQRPVDGEATAYVCREQACEAPTTDVSRMLSLLGLGDEAQPKRAAHGAH